MSAKTVKVDNVSLKASEQELKEFFSFSGDIIYLEMKRDNEEFQIAYVTFKDSQGAETAVLLSGATIVDKTVTVTLESDYELPPAALAPPADGAGGAQAALRKAEDVVTNMLAKGFILGKDAVAKAKSFDDKHQLTSTASIKIASLDQKIGLTEKISMGTSAVNNRVKEMDEKYQVSEKTKSAIAAAEEKVSSAGSAIMKNRYVLTGTTWVTGAFNRVAKAADGVGQKTVDKVGMTEDEQKRKMVDDFAKVHLSESDSPKADSSPKAESFPNDTSSPREVSSPSEEQQPTKPEPAQGLIL